MNFYIDLNIPKLNRMWEFCTFKEFLDEKYSNDELYFYLHCRYLIFRGPMLNHSIANHSIIVYVKYGFAEFLVE